jgi:hypothetical protein
VLHKCLSEDKGGYSHQFDKNVDAWATSVFHGISDGVTDNGIVVWFSLLCHNLAIDKQVLAFDELFGVVPRTSGVRERNSYLNSTHDSSCQQAAYTSGSQQESEDKWSEDNKKAWRDHHPD